ncbi:hypothetical protein GCM10008941_30520 [Rhizomicrobium palustre]
MTARDASGGNWVAPEILIHLVITLPFLLNALAPWCARNIILQIWVRGIEKQPGRVSGKEIL